MVEKIFQLIDNFFLASLKFFVDKAESQRDFAKKVGVPLTTIRGYLYKNKDGQEDIRRLIASGRGYPGRQDENFLDIGRAILSGNEPRIARDTHTNHGFGSDIKALDWLAPYLNSLKSLDKRGQDCVIALIRTYSEMDRNGQKRHR
jgi:hypothetical protein